MIESLKEEADLLIIDTPPCGVLSDAALFGRNRRRCSSRGTPGEQRKDREVQRALEFFEDSQIPVCGYVLNGVPEGATGYGYSTLWRLRVRKIWLRLRKVRLWEREGSAGTVTSQAKGAGRKSMRRS
ncbi:MAG: hypothetical protein ACLRIL_11505 [Fusicatenibacter saccharivorans]